MSIKHLIILLIIKLYAQNKIYNEKVFNGKKSLKKNQKICKKKTILAGFIKSGKIFFNNLNPSYVTDNEFIWKTIKPSFFSNQKKHGTNIKLVERDEMFLNGDEKNVVELSLLENSELCQMGNLIRQSQNKISWLMISISILDKEIF